MKNSSRASVQNSGNDNILSDRKLLREYFSEELIKKFYVPAKAGMGFTPWSDLFTQSLTQQHSAARSSLIAV